MRDFFIHNALYWLTEYRFDGLRLDAVQAIAVLIDTIFRGIMVPQKEPFINLKVNIEDNLKPKGGRS